MVIFLIYILLVILKGKQLEQIQLFFVELNSPNVYNLVVLFKHHFEGGYIDNILECCFPRQVLLRRSPSPRCQLTSWEWNEPGCTNVAWRKFGKF
jgi:hypothetical protein